MMESHLDHGLGTSHPLLPDVFTTVNIDQLINFIPENGQNDTNLTFQPIHLYLLLFLELETVKSGQKRRSESAKSKVLARGCPACPLFKDSLRSGLDQKKLFQSESSNMYGMILVRNLLQLITVCWSELLLQLLSTASVIFSTNCKMTGWVFKFEECRIYLEA